MRRLALFALLASGCGATPHAHATATATPTATPVASLDDLAWLAGGWRTEEIAPMGERPARERGGLAGRRYFITQPDCAAPEPGSASGCEGEEQTLETIEIAERDGSLFYISSADGRGRSELPITEVGARGFVAERAVGDAVTTRVEYQLEDGRLRVRISSAEQPLDARMVAR